MWLVIFRIHCVCVSSHPLPALHLTASISARIPSNSTHLVPNSVVSYPYSNLRRATSLESQSNRIFGGDVVKEPAYAKYVVRLEQNNHYCTASIIASRWLVTAAHCNIKSSSQVIIGNYGHDNGTFNFVDKVYRHPQFKRSTSTLLNDIALVYLKKAVTQSLRLTLATSSNQALPKSGTESRVSGYGSYKLGTLRRSQLDLRYAYVKSLNHSQCHHKLVSEGYMSQASGLNDKMHICTDKSDEGHGICLGDSGGPLVMTNSKHLLVQIGVVSYFMGECNDDSLPSVYTRISSYKEWIDSVTEGEAVFAELE